MPTDTDFQIRSAADYPDADFEVRASGDDGLTLDGFASLYAMASREMPVAVAIIAKNTRALPDSGARRFREILEPGAWAASVGMRPDITLQWAHDLATIPLGRTKSGTFTVADESRGLKASAKLPDNEWGRPIRDGLVRKDIDGFSVRFRSVREEWGRQDGEQVRHIFQADLGPEISIVTRAAYDGTSPSVRELADEIGADADALALAFHALRDPAALVTAEQRDLIQAALNAKTDPADVFVGPRLARARERLAAIAS